MMEFILKNQWDIAVIALALVAMLVIYLMSHRLQKLSEKYKPPYSHMVLCLKKPFRLLEYALVVMILLQAVALFSPKTVTDVFVKHYIFLTIIVSVTVYFNALIARVSKWMRDLAKKNNSNERLTYINGMSQLSKVALFLVVLLAVMDHFNMSYTGIIAVGGAGSLAAALAAKDLVGNLFGGLIIFLDKPFHVGDFISSPDKKIEGIVQHIGWRVTEVLSLEQVPMFVPNALFTTIIIQNLSNRKKRRMREVIGIRYKDLDRMPLILADIKKQLDEFSFISQEDTKYVHLVAFNQSTVDILVQCMMIQPGYADFLKHKQEVLEMISDKLGEHGAAMAFPSISIYKDSGDQQESYGKQQ